jgi:hypothetical protein
MATILELIENMPKGKSLNRRENGAFRMVHHSPKGEGYRVIGSYLVPAKYDEDPESVTCGCPLAGESHAHVEADHLTAEDAAKAYEELQQNMNSMNRVTFAKAERIGG